MAARSLALLLLATPVLALRPARAPPAVRARVQRPPLVTPPLLEEATAALWHAAADADFREAKRARDAKNDVQREATDAVMQHFFGGGDGVGDGDGSGGSRAMVVLPGGAGKTVLGLRVAEAMHPIDWMHPPLPRVDAVANSMGEMFEENASLSDQVTNLAGMVRGIRARQGADLKAVVEAVVASSAAAANRGQAASE